MLKKRSPSYGGLLIRINLNYLTTLVAVGIGFFLVCHHIWLEMPFVLNIPSFDCSIFWRVLAVARLSVL